MSGLEFARRVRRRAPGAKIVPEGIRCAPLKRLVSVTDEDGSVTVGLTSADCPDEWNGRGSCGSSLRFVVVISKEDMHVIRSNYVE